MPTLSRICCAAIAVLCLSSGIAAAGPLEEATAAFDREDYPTALRLLTPLAEEGNATAQLKLGIMYLGEMGMKHPNIPEGLKWFRRSAAQGNPLAMVNLAFMYAKGQGVDPDLVESYKWYDLAAARLDGHELLPRVKETRDKIGTRLSPEQLADARQRIAAWKPE